MLDILIPNHASTFYWNHDSSILVKSSKDSTNRMITIHCIGTPLYENVPEHSIFQQIITDFFTNKLKQDRLKGNFLILMIEKNDLKVLCDKTHQHQLFYDKNNELLSTSYLELVRNNSYPLKLNTYGFYEKIALGFHLSEDTEFDSIIRISPENVNEVKAFNIEYLSDHELPKLDNIKLHSGSRKKSLKLQESVLNDYFSLINQTFRGKTGDLGISGGFDCRLVLALAQKNITKPLHLHSHATIDVHEGQSKYADIIAESYGASLTKVSTTSPSKLDNESFTKMLDDNLDFFDARSARHLGAYSQTYTQSYKTKSMAYADYSLNGLGGEVYRDSYFTGSEKMSWDEWAERYLFLTGAKSIVPSIELEKVSAKAKKILEKRLHWNKEYYDIMFTHAYYGLIKMPLCNGSVVSAYNKVSPFILPFVEYSIVIEALKATPYLGIGGQYQAELITRISSSLAKLPTHYGGTFKSLGLKYYTWSYIKTKARNKHRDAIVQKKLIKKTESPAFKKEWNKLNGKEAFNKSINKLKHIDERLNIQVAFAESTHKRNIILLGYFLRNYS